MEIREKGEGDTIPEGASVTPSSQADYFYFRRGQQVINVRIASNEPLEIRMFFLTDGDL